MLHAMRFGGRCGLLGCLVVALALLAVPALPASAACDPATEICDDPSDTKNVVTSSTTISLDGFAFYSPAGEFVDISSKLHLNARVRCDAGSLALHANVARARAIGATSGQRFSFTGSDRALPPNPIRCGFPNDPIRVSVAFRLFPNDPIRLGFPNDPIRVFVDVDLGFDAQGRLSTATASFAE